MQYNMTIVTIPYSFRPAIFFKFGFLGQSNGQLDSKRLESGYLGSTEELPILQILCWDLFKGCLIEIERTIPPVRNTNNDPRISWASCEGMLHASLMQFNIICVKETLLKGSNCSGTIEKFGCDQS